MSIRSGPVTFPQGRSGALVSSSLGFLETDETAFDAGLHGLETQATEGRPLELPVLGGAEENAIAQGAGAALVASNTASATTVHNPFDTTRPGWALSGSGHVGRLAAMSADGSVAVVAVAGATYAFETVQVYTRHASGVWRYRSSLGLSLAIKDISMDAAGARVVVVAGTSANDISLADPDTPVNEHLKAPDAGTEIVACQVTRDGLHKMLSVRNTTSGLSTIERYDTGAVPGTAVDLGLLGGSGSSLTTAGPSGRALAVPVPPRALAADVTNAAGAVMSSDGRRAAKITDDGTNFYLTAYVRNDETGALAAAGAALVEAVDVGNASHRPAITAWTHDLACVAVALHDGAGTHFFRRDGVVQSAGWERTATVDGHVLGAAMSDAGDAVLVDSRADAPVFTAGVTPDNNLGAARVVAARSLFQPLPASTWTVGALSGMDWATMAGTTPVPADDATETACCGGVFDVPDGGVRVRLMVVPRVTGDVPLQVKIGPRATASVYWNTRWVGTYRNEASTEVTVGYNALRETMDLASSTAARLRPDHVALLEVVAAAEAGTTSHVDLTGFASAAVADCNAIGYSGAFLPLLDDVERAVADAGIVIVPYVDGADRTTVLPTDGDFATHNALDLGTLPTATIRLEGDRIALTTSSGVTAKSSAIATAAVPGSDAAEVTLAGADFECSDDTLSSLTFAISSASDLARGGSKAAIDALVGKLLDACATFTDSYF